jgi:hypothetical protein
VKTYSRRLACGEKDEQQASRLLYDRRDGFDRSRDGTDLAVLV